MLPWQQPGSGPQTTLRPIVRPGGSSWAAVWTPGTSASWQVVLVAFLIAVAIAACIGAGLWLGPVGGVVGAAALVAAIGAGFRTANRDVVAAPRWTFQGAPIDGEAFRLLEDIDARFAYAESNVERLPTGIVWSEVGEDVRALLWEAAEHAARVTALDAQVHDMRYAEPGTPQAALKSTLEQERAAHWNIMRGVQWEAELLARTAGNAVAAAHVALARAGSLDALRRITPSRQAIVAAGALAEARSRLELLAEVWSELDESGAIAAERLDADRRRALGEGT